MEKLPAVSPSVNLPMSFYARRPRRQVECQACPWCQGPMYLNRAGDRLQCIDAAQCAGVAYAAENHPRIVPAGLRTA